MAGIATTGHSISATPERFWGRIRLTGPSIGFHPWYFGRLALVVAAYYAAAHLGYAFEFSGPVAAIVWLPVGVAIAALYLLGPQLWPAVVIGDFLVNNYSAVPLGSAIGQSFGNLLEVLVAALLLRRFASRNAPFESGAGIAGLLAALMAGTVISATLGSMSLVLGHVIALHSAWSVWRTWWLGDLCGALIVVPLAIAWIPPPRRLSLPRHPVEAVLLAVTLVVLSTVAAEVGRPLSYLAFPALIWAAVRFGPRGATLVVAIATAFTIYATTHYLGPFHYKSVNRELLDTQLYLVVSTMSTLLLAALAHEREVLAASVLASRRRIVAAADDERHRIERNLHDGAQQRLIALAAHLGLAAQSAHADPAGAAASFDSAQNELELAIEELRELVHGIRPPALRRFGLTRAVELVAARCATPIELTELPSERLDDTAEATAYYIVLEALTNAQRYAHASMIRVNAHLSPGDLLLAIEDDGVGGAVERDALGLQGLRDRVEATGGTFGVESEPGSGTRITAEIPAAVVPRGSA
jgi:signal transduction histidine kinase